MNGWVAYVQSSTLHIASADGSVTVDHAAIGAVGCPTFAPVGRLLAYRQDGNFVFTLISERGAIGAQLAVPAPWAPVGEGCPVWSPDGRAVAQATREAVEIISIDGSRRRIQLPRRGWSRSIAWSHDASAILTTRVAGRRAEVVMVPLDGEEPIVLYETASRWDYNGLSSSPNGPYFAVIIPSCVGEPATDEMGSCLRVADLDGNVLFDEPLGPGSTVAWAPDGQRLAWFDPERRIRVRSIDAAESYAIPMERQVEGAGGHMVVEDTFQRLAWSPDGTRLLCEVSYTGERHEHAIVSVAADGSGDVIVHSGWQAEIALIDWRDLSWQRL